MGASLCQTPVLFVVPMGCGQLAAVWMPEMWCYPPLCRLKAVGGDPKDAALQQMLDSFKHERIPKDLLDGGSVRKGTVMTFTKDQQGGVIARANDHELATVQSPKLAAAIFDIYLGEPCVSKESRLAAGKGVVNMMAGTHSSPSVRGLCNRNVQACNFTR